MNIADFEALLADLLAPHVTKVCSYQAGGYTLYGAQIRLGGDVAWIRLTRTSPPVDTVTKPDPRDGDPLPDPQPIPDRLARQVEALLIRVLVTGGIPDLVWAMTFHDRASQRSTAEPVGGQTQAGVAAHLADGTEFYMTLSG